MNCVSIRITNLNSWLIKISLCLEPLATGAIQNQFDHFIVHTLSLHYSCFVHSPVNMSGPRVSIKKVLISDACDSSCATLLEKNGIEVQSKYKLGTDALIAELKVI